MARPLPEPVYVTDTNTELHSLAFLTDITEEKLLAGGKDGQIIVWDLKTRRTVLEFPGGTDGPCLSLLTPDQGGLLSHCRGGEVVSWSRAQDGSWTRDFALPARGLGFCGARLISLSHRQVVAYPEDGDLAVAETKGGPTPVARVTLDKTLGQLMGLSGAGPFRVVGLFEGGTLVLWDVRKPSETLASTSVAVSAEDYAAMCVSVDERSGRGVVGSSANSLAAFTLEADHVTELAGAALTNPGVAAATFRGDGKLVATAGWDSRVRIFGWRSSGLQPLAVLESHSGAGLQAVAFSPGHVPSWQLPGLLAAAGRAGRVTFWDVFN